MNLPELVAPAGSCEALAAGYDHGADAAYAGLASHNLRAHAPNFTYRELERALRLAHERGKRLYLTLNTMPTDDELARMEQALVCLRNLSDRPDAVIVSDPGVLELCREHLPEVPLHLSTQTGTFNSRGARFWTRNGISRVVVPRELSLEQITSLCRTGIPCEVFVHGAMCVSISGRCLLGAYLSGRHPNFGDCPQPCRSRYRIVPLHGGDGFEAEEGERGVYLLNSKDLNTISILDRIAASGVAALKIEGRNKSVHYVAAVVKVYRAALDRLAQGLGDYRPEPAWVEELESLDHRPYTTGFYAGELALQEPHASKAGSRRRVVGIVRARIGSGKIVVDVKNPFRVGEVLDVLPIGTKRSGFEISFGKLSGLEGEDVDRALTNRLVVAESVGGRLEVGDMLRLRAEN